MAKLVALGDALPADTLARERAKLSELSGGIGRVTWDEMVAILAKNPQIPHIQPAWKNRGEGGHVLAEDPVKMAQMLLLREFFRRPKKQNNAETMGLAKLAWPKLEQRLKTGKLPDDFVKSKLSVEDWIALHEVAIDAAFRSNFAVKADRYPVNFPHWISPREKSRTLYGPETRNSDVTGKNPVHWPSAKRSERSTMVRLIGRLLEADPKTDSGKSKIDGLLLTMWQNLSASKVIENSNDTRWVVDMGFAEFRSVQRAGICPSTRRMLSSHPGNISPTSLDGHEIDQWVEVPKLIVSKPGGLSLGDRKKVRIWCDTDPLVGKLRAMGQWGNLHDSVAEFTPVLRAQEHSAQIDRPSLKTYEDQFRDGQLNLLNCSTTMEMGVDLAEIEAVINTNVPPSPANYRQRIGRAGRRGEPWAIAFTFCRDLPLDRRVWNDPAVLLEASIAAPMVNLDSRVILQRHVNAFFLGRFLADNGGLKLGTGAGDFFGAKAEVDLKNPFAENCVADRLIDALRGDWGRSGRVSDGLKSLLTGTPLSGEIDGLAEATCDAFSTLRSSWSNEYLTLVKSQSVAELVNSTAESRFFKSQSSRMRKEFLLAELARRGFTPSYGFPIDVVGFSYIGEAPSESVREEGTRFASGPSRSLDVALRDYAPGSEVVVDGLVYRSDGILPSWASHTSPGEDLRDMWICGSCGEHGLDTAWRETCPKCDAPLEVTRRRRILKPSGFLSKDSVPHTAYEQLNWVAPERPRLSVSDAEWQSLSDPDLGRIRSSRMGRILQRSSGPWAEGFAICLACGRADAEKDPGGIIDGESYALPTGMKNHSPLVRTDRARRDDGKCIGLDPTSRAIQRNVHLGYETHSDIFELQLFPLEKVENSVAWALGSAIREALSMKLGIQAHDEIGVAIQHATFESGVSGASILLFDKAPGGAGFSTLAGSPGMIEQLLQDAENILDCNKCTNGCPDCILRPDLQHDGTPMDRAGALSILKKEVLNKLGLPSNLRVFGDNTTALHRGAVQWILAKVRGTPPEAITVFLHGNCETLDLSEWRAVAALKLLPPTCKISIAVPNDLLSAMRQSHKRDLLRVLARLDAKLVRVPFAPKFSELPQIIEEKTGNTVSALVASDPKSALVGVDWGRASSGPILFGKLDSGTELFPISINKLMDFGEANAIVHEFHSELDGRIEDFGLKFWKKIRSLRPQTFADGVTVLKLEYADRYVKSPLSLALAISVVKSAPNMTATTTVSISTTRLENRDYGRSIWDNWPDNRSREQVIREIDSSIKLNISEPRDCPHERRLIVELSNGSMLKVRLDQGFGAWAAERESAPYSFEFAPTRQAVSMMKSSVKVYLRDTKTGTPISIVWDG
ncbi:DUF1998 domain-containing protein [Falsihalocynthiibacter arcticus]|uniref:Helicase C-terminal domain-containing protein n=1 Tax=Falsihalocynthiibacter arcticus TaxID=1579316 RepID=A0A126V541_9RHOB|nr:helicase-related protein [Falsihalocynthiibacter arcticus]AML52819.1 hypothetical protein RC74_17535 [Falsihalocynthiibacter arcticus]